MNSVAQSLVLPYVDLTLISCNAATAILTNMILSTKVLGEQFIWRYDLTAMFFITIGTITIVLQANTKPVSFSGEDIRDLLLTFRTIFYLSICIVLFIADRFTLSRTLNNLRQFEAEAEAYDESLHNVIYKAPSEAIKGL